MTRLATFQMQMARDLTRLAVCQVPVLALIGWLLERDVVMVAGIAAMLAALPVAAIALKRPLLISATAVTVALVGHASLLVYAFSGHPWQVETHFYYFAVLAMAAGFCEPGVLLLAAALIAVHHLALNALMPAVLYGGGSDWGRVAMHAAFVLIETAALLRIGASIRAAFAEAESACDRAETAAAALRQGSDDREREITERAHYAELMERRIDDFEREMAGAADFLHSAAQGLNGSADTLGRTAAHSSAQSVTATVASDATAQKVQSAAAAGEELATTIAEVGSNAMRSSALAADAVGEAAKASSTIDELAAVAGEIGKVTDLISAIAAQTNLLALNATIEAARAGESGRGFAVVAQEVKALAGQTAAATKDIGLRVDAMQAATGRSVQAIQLISGTIRELDQSSARIAEAVEQQAAAAREIAGSVHYAASSVIHVNEAVGEIEIVAEQTSGSILQLSTAASDIADQTRRIREQVSSFTRDIQALRA